MDYRPGIANRHGVVCPIHGQLANGINHFPGRHFWAGCDFQRLPVTCGEQFHMSAANIDHKDFHPAFTSAAALHNSDITIVNGKRPAL
jgi:hypothetical protein